MALISIRFSCCPILYLKYLTHYPEPLQVQVRTLITENRLGEVLRKRYPEPNTVRTERAFYQLCHHMAPDNAQLEFDLRPYLTHLDVTQCQIEPWSVPLAIYGHN